MFYALYLFAVVLIIYIYYKLQLASNSDTSLKEDVDDRTITYPERKIIVSPFLHERVKNLFELKHQKKNMNLEYDEKENILIGCYSDAIHNYRYLIYCSTSINNVSMTTQQKVLETLTSISKNINESDELLYTPLYLYITEGGSFDTNNTELKCYTEKNLINGIVDFNNYLNKNINRFNEKLSDMGGTLLNDSFIEPKFNKGKANLASYLDNWLEEKSYKHICLLADYGMGKTSFLKYYTKYLSEKIIKGEKFNRYPVFISLTNTSPMSNDGIETKVKGFVSEELGVNYSLFERLIDLGKIVFILDGFDEMGFIGTAKTRFEQFNSIWNLATTNNKVLISGRPSYLPTKFERKNALNIVDASLSCAEVNPYTEVIKLDFFTKIEIVNTLNVYFDKDKDVEKYLKYIVDNKSIFDLCKRPSMLHMTMSILPSLYNAKSNKRITSFEVMNKYTEYWISRQEKKRIKGLFRSNDNTKKDFVINLFSEVASEMYKNKSNTLSKANLDTLIVKEVTIYDIEITKNKISLEGLVNELYSGYFIEVDIDYTNDDNFKFVHKSIFEYFVAKKIISIIHSKDFSEPLLSMEWTQEIIDFIDHSIDDEKSKKSNMPTLLALKDSFVDKYIGIPITKMYFYQYTEPFLYLLGFLLGVKENFIAKAYFMEYRNNKPVKNKQMEYFINHYKIFYMQSDMAIKNLSLNSINIRELYYKNSDLNNIDLSCSKVRLLNIKNSNIDNIDFSNAKIRAIKFDNCKIMNLNIGNAIPLNMSKFQVEQLLFSSIHFNKIIFKFLRLTKMKLFRNIIAIKKMRIIIHKMESSDFDEYSITSLQKFIKKNNIKRKYILCPQKLKNILFCTHSY